MIAGQYVTDSAEPFCHNPAGRGIRIAPAYGDRNRTLAYQAIEGRQVIKKVGISVCIPFNLLAGSRPLRAGRQRAGKLNEFSPPHCVICKP